MKLFISCLLVVFAFGVQQVDGQVLTDHLIPNFTFLTPEETEDAFQSPEYDEIANAVFWYNHDINTNWIIGEVEDFDLFYDTYDMKFGTPVTFIDAYLDVDGNGIINHVERDFLCQGTTEYNRVLGLYDDATFIPFAVYWDAQTQTSVVETIANGQNVPEFEYFIDFPAGELFEDDFGFEQIIHGGPHCTAAGDIDLDGDVDARDILRVCHHYQMQTSPSTWSKGDFNDNGVTDFFDLAITFRNAGLPVPDANTNSIDH